MNATRTDPATAVKAEAEQIVTSGTDVRPRLAEAVARSAAAARHPGGLVALVRAAVEGARDGLARAGPKDRDDTLRQVVDALGDGLSQAALAGRLALQEAAGTSRRFADEDLARLRDDLTAVRDLFAETVDRGVAACRALTGEQVEAVRRHAGRVAERFGPAVERALDAVRRHPAAFAGESLAAGVDAGKAAAGALFQAIGHRLQRAGEKA